MGMIKSFLQKLVGIGENTKPQTQSVAPRSEQECNAILRKARQLHVDQQHDECLAELFPLIQSNPEKGEAHFLAGKSLYAGKNFQAAASALMKATELGVSDPSSDAMLASSLTEIGDYERALEFALSAYEKRKTDPQICILTAQLYFRFESYELAAEFYSKALEQAPRSFDALIGLVTLNNLAQSILRRSLITTQVLNSKKYYIKKLRAGLQDFSLLGVKELHNLLVLTMGDKDLFAEIASPCANELYARQGLDASMALTLARYFFSLGDMGKTAELFLYCKENTSSFNLIPIVSLGQIYIATGGKRWREGWEVFDQAFFALYASKRANTVPAWNGERLNGKRLFVYQEQGAGDVLLGLRVFRSLRERGINFTFFVNKGLADLFKTADFGDDIIESEIRPDPRDYGCDFAVPLFGLIRVLKLDQKEMKQPVSIKSLPGRCEEWRKKIQALPGLRLGLVATGNPWRSDDWMRSIEESNLELLADVQGVSWVNLAFDERPERDAIVRRFRALNPAPTLRDFADTAAIIDALDAVVAIDCSVAHLAAALGKPVFVLAPSFVDWRWRIGDDTQPWWPNAKTFFSPFPGEWKVPIEQLVAELKLFIEQRR
jgi:tetratricopeptide (TPR) repeat protein